jgi:hypothetical protein
LRFLVFLILDREPAILLHATGVLVSVPAPQRFVLHKLIVARRRRQVTRNGTRICFKLRLYWISW